MSKPIVRQIGTRQEFYWEKEKIYALVNRIKEHSDGRVTAEIAFKVDKPDIPPHILHSQVSLLSTRSKKDVVKELEDTYPLPEGQWKSMVEQLCVIALDNHRKGKPAKEVWPALDSEEIPRSELLIEPLIYKNKPNMLFGEGSCGKSYLAITLAITAQLPFSNNPLWLSPKQANTLYLDWEADENEFKRRLSEVERGFSLPPAPILYRECELPLVEDIDHLEQMVAEHQIGFVIIDSLGIASGNANLNDAATATAFYSALRRLKVTSLIITHMSKEAETKRATPFGSVYFTNLARSVFEVRKHQEEEANEIAIDLVHRKNNQGPLLPHQGFKIVFEPEKTLIKRLEVETVPEFLEKMSLKARIIALLKEGGKASVTGIAEELDKTDAQVRAALNKYKNIFVKVGDQWGLKA